MHQGVYLHNSNVVYTKTWENVRDTAPLIQLNLSTMATLGSNFLAVEER